MLGKILKGNESCKHPGSSIPTKYQTVVISSEERKGFCSQAKRFSTEDCQNGNPGPGTYMCLRADDFNSPSFSKKGAGGLASQAVRVHRNPQRGIPGPNAYNLQSSLINKHSFGRGGTRMFQPPVAVQLDSPKNKTPAPNQYNTCPKAILSCFKSNTSRIYSPLDNRVPGPGSYSPYKAPEPVKRTILPRRHYLGISAPPLTVPKNPPQPGPGQYNIADYGDPVKQLMSSAVFLSGTSRWSKAMEAQEVPGPGFYEPEMSSKQSFLYNHNKNWIPA
ncbi:O(6)-methylguanine-induced apoptosis 2 [Aplochiton taeniatus]